jgi:hypothetical protein
MLAERIVTGNLDDDIGPQSQQLIECPNYRQTRGAMTWNSGPGESRNDLELVAIALRQVNNRLANRAKPDQANASWPLSHRHRSLLQS